MLREIFTICECKSFYFNKARPKIILSAIISPLFITYLGKFLFGSKVFLLKVFLSLALHYPEN